MATDEQFDSHFLCLVAECLLVSPGDDLMSVDHADTYSAEIEDLSYLCVYFLLLEVRQGFIFVVALDDVEDGGEGLAPIENFSAAHIAGAEDGANLVGDDHLLVFGGYLCRSEGNMEIPHD